MSAPVSFAQMDRAQLHILRTAHLYAAGLVDTAIKPTLLQIREAR